MNLQEPNQNPTDYRNQEGRLHLPQASSLRKLLAGKLSQVPDLKEARGRQWLESSGERNTDLGASPTDWKPQALRQAPDLCASIA